MLKLYVGTKIRIQHSTEELVNRFVLRSDPDMSEQGFASAEMIALAVVGVLIVFGIYYIFKGVIDDKLDDWVGGIFDGSSGGSGGGGTPSTTTP